ncbi:flagellar protein FlgN, partial [Halorubrum sp. ARQ200]
MTPTAPLTTLVEQQLERVQALQSVLEQEAGVIASRASEDIEAIAKQKQSLINEIQRNDAQISRHPERDLLNHDQAL